MAQGRRRQLGGVDRLPSGRWRVRLLEPVGGQRVSIGSFKTKAEAERAFAAAVTDQQKGAWVAPEKGRVTLDEYAWRWLDTRLRARGERLRPRPESCTRASSGCTSCRPSAPCRSAGSPPPASAAGTQAC